MVRAFWAISWAKGWVSVLTLSVDEAVRRRRDAYRIVPHEEFEILDRHKLVDFENGRTR